MRIGKQLFVSVIVAACALSSAARAQESKATSGKEPATKVSGGNALKDQAAKPSDAKGVTKEPAAQTSDGKPAPKEPAGPARPRVQIALLLDTSSSMQGLIQQAKTQLWKIVNQFIRARRNGKTPDFEVALYEYGNKTLGKSSNYLRQVAPLTDNLDRISEVLFALRIMSHGSQEYCGAVIDKAVKELRWSESRDDLAVIFVAGNESFSQGGVDYREAAKAANRRGVIVNTIYCGSYPDGIRLGWKDGAIRAEGAYASIDQSRTVAHVATPHDKELRGLGLELNGTYVPYGALGRKGKNRQTSQDKEADASQDGSLERTVSKSYALYSNSGWDLVDALSAKKVKLEDLKTEDLPEVMRKMNLEERKNYIETKAKKRKTIQAEIQALSELRKKHLEAFKATEKPGGSKRSAGTLGSAVTEILRQQAARKKFEFKKS